MKEGMRCASTVQMSLERIVPLSGMEICGRYIPPGSTVGCLQQVIHLNQNVYGYDAAIFRPERWTEASDDVQKSMERCGMWFGHGKHMCLGQHFARAGMMKLLAMMLMRFDIFAVDPNARLIPKVSTLGGPAGRYYIRVKPKQDVNQSKLRPVQPDSLSNDKEHEEADAINMALPVNSGEVPTIGNMEKDRRKVADITTQLQENFPAVSNAGCSYVRPNDNYHGFTDDLLTCDGICHEPRSICIDELRYVVANCTASAGGGTHSMNLWLRMAREALGELDKENEEVLVSDVTSVTSPDGLFAWSTPENAAIAMSGGDHASLYLPIAVCWPLSTFASSGSFHPTWVEDSIGFITAQSAGCLFNSHLVVTRSTTPTSRIHHVSVLTGLEIARVGNLATGALSGLFFLANHKPENMVGNTRAVSTFFMGLAYADELASPDQGGEWSHLSNLAGPLLAAERLISGPLPELFDRALFGYHCCTVRARAPLDLTPVPIQTLFLARFYDSTLPAYLDCIKCLEPGSVLPARATTWGTLLSNDVFDYVSDGLSGRVANLCWAMGTWDSPIECARMFRGCLIAVARTAHHAPGSLFALLYMEFTYLYTARYFYSSIPCDTNLSLDDTYIPYSVVDIPTPGATPISGFRATLRAAFSASSYDPHNALFDPLTPFDVGSAVNTANGSLPPWQGLAATPCAWDIAYGEFDVVAMRATHDILGCLDRGVYADSPGLYRAHLGWLIRQYDSLVAAGRDNLGVGRYYVANRVS
ncbi:uncharacterized protein N7483_005043 [Penicillium malachiteum]|uniref:uncharacterized protein n=1 Tax=Penicillium malachiteum TaxID=1324776 RepID=UPI0025492A9C|nr:uncharacterized protein N7483_005043 [Penicillium malachiteum]KAJ5730535.1 hypothetical protein N7483_005043 [Penicillium malachiteum]